MRVFSRRAALLLLPILVQAIVLPNEIIESESQSRPTRHNFGSAGYGGPATFFQYNITDDSIKFTIPCPDCSDEEKKALEQRIIHIKPILKSTQHCTSADPIGLEINGSPVQTTETSSSALQAHTGAFNLGNHTEHHILKHIRWINQCGCIHEHQNDEECEGDFESAFSLQYLGLPSGQVPGFTASYKQHGKPELLRFSTFPEIDISNAWKFGQSAHYRSPLLRLQKPLSPTTATIISSISNLPSSTTSASLPSYTYYEHNPKIIKESPAPATTTLSPTGQTVQQQVSSGSQAPTFASSKKSHWCHIPNPLSSVSHGLELFGMKAKSGAQDILGKVQNVMSPTHSELAFLHTTSSLPQSTNDVSHDELGDLVVEDLSPSASTASSPAVVDDEDGFYFQDLPAFKWLKNDPSAANAFKLTCIIVSALGLSIALTGATFSFLRTNSRLRTSLAALAEEDHCNRCYVEVRSSWQEFRTRRLYRRAARKHRILTFFGLRSSCPDEKNIEATAQQEVEETWSEEKTSLDYNSQDEEKGTLALRKNLLAFRKTHQFVNRIISSNQAEQRRDHRLPRARHGRSWSFSSEKTAPPAYQSDCEDLILDADGPRFVVIRRGTNGSDVSPESSVVSTSPRTSCADSDSEHDEKF